MLLTFWQFIKTATKYLYHAIYYNIYYHNADSALIAANFKLTLIFLNSTCTSL